MNKHFISLALLTTTMVLLSNPGWCKAPDNNAFFSPKPPKQIEAQKQNNVIFKAPPKKDKKFVASTPKNTVNLTKKAQKKHPQFRANKKYNTIANNKYGYSNPPKPNKKNNKHGHNNKIYPNYRFQ